MENKKPSVQETSDIIFNALVQHIPEDQNAILSGVINTVYEIRLKQLEAASAARNIAEVDLETFIKIVTGNKS